VFASRPLTGNPVALVPDADRLDESQMRAIAREFNQSETTFLLRPNLSAATIRLRSFTSTGAAVGGAGHNALGAWLWLEAAGMVTSEPSEYAQEIAGAMLPAEIIREPGGPVTVHEPRSRNPSRSVCACLSAAGAR
jgi:PhzF family phenazine biosynthesis protein